MNTGGYRDWGLLHALSFFIDQFHGGRLVVRHGEVAVVGGSLPSHHDTSHGGTSKCVTEVIGQRRVDGLHRFVIPRGGKDHVFIQSFEGGAPVDLEAHDSSAGALFKEE